jgi:hypothetical protein
MSTFAPNTVEVNQARNWDGFFTSPEYVKFTDAMQGQMGDQEVYFSPYFGEITGQVFGAEMDYAFEAFQTRIQNEKPYKVEVRGYEKTAFSSGYWLMLVAAAAYFLS